MNIRQTLLAAAAVVPMALASAPSHAVSVGLELSLLIDVSGSVDTTEFNLQKQGYVTAFQSAAVQNAIIASTGGGIAVNLIQWSGSSEQVQSVGWTLVNSAASANALATAINGIVRAFAGSTAPGSAINFARPLFGTETGGAANGFESARQVIDVSGDGAENDGANTATARNNALAAGVDTINGLAILGEAGLLAFYQNNIQGGTNSFTEVANDFQDFADAIQRKLIREITGVPEPATMVAFGAALLGLAGLRRRA